MGTEDTKFLKTEIMEKEKKTINEYLQKLGIGQKDKHIDLSKVEKEVLKKQIKEKKEWVEQANKELEKRPKNTIEMCGTCLSNLSSGGMIILMLSIFYFGAMSAYVGVTNEFINPTNSSLGLNNTFEMVNNAMLEITTKYLIIGEDNARVFFWLWWGIVFFSMILPILKLVSGIISLRMKNYKEKKR